MNPNASMEPHPIPFIYRLVHLYVEPVFAFLGSVQLLFKPELFFSNVSTRVLSPATLPESRIITDQLGAFMLLFAFNEAVVLRATRDTNVWRLMALGILICDGLHLLASVRDQGWAYASDPAAWRGLDWVNYGILYVGGLLRLCLVLGVGVGGKTKVN
jgi:hypothetical protein